MMQMVVVEKRKMTFKEELEFGSNFNYLITVQGQTINCPGGNHAKICKKTFGCSLEDFLHKNYGCRVIVYGEEIAIEYCGHLSDKQCNRINAILQSRNYYRLVTTQHNCRESFRPIKRIYTRQ